MKKIITFTIFVFISQMASSQACGIYHIKYVGEVLHLNNKIISIKLPSISFLNGDENGKSDFAFVETQLKGNQIEQVVSSRLTSALFNKASNYLKIYQAKHEKIPIIFRILKDNKELDVTIELSWEQIKMTRIKLGKSKYFFEVNLGGIHLKA